MIGVGSWGLLGVIRGLYLAAMVATFVLVPAPDALAASALKTDLLPVLSIENPNPNLGVRGQAECGPSELRVRLDRVAAAKNPILVVVLPPPSKSAPLVEARLVESVTIDEAGRGELRVRGAPACMSGDLVFVVDSALKLLLVGVLR